MTKKTKIASFACLSVLAVSVVAALGTKGLTKSTADGTWYHYDAVEATTKSVGSKEYWTDCNGTTVLTEPAGEIEEKGQPTQAFINKLALNDERRVAQIGTIDFEDESDFTLFTINSSASQIVEDESATSGSHVLKITAKGTSEGNCMAHVQLKTDMMDKLFADPNVKGVWFDIKGSGQFNNFRRETSSKGATPYDYDFSGGPDKQGNYWKCGIDTVWKSFCFERSFYEESKTYDKPSYFIKVESLPVNAEIYIDNIRIQSYGRESWTHFGFETGTLRCNNENGTEYYSYGYARKNDSRYVTSQNGNNCDFRILGTAGGGQATSVTWDYTRKSEGNRSLKIVKPAAGNPELRLELPAEFATNCPGSGYLMDVFFDENINGEDVNAGAGGINTLQFANNIVEAGKPRTAFSGSWITIFIPLSKLTPTSDGFIRVLRWSGSQSNGVFWIDNFRPAFDTFGFEDISYGNSASNGEVGLCNVPASERKGGQNLRDNYDHLFYFNGGVTSVSSSTDFATEGTKSLKYVHGAGNNYFAIYCNKYLFDQLPDGYSLSIDVMTTDGEINNFCGNQKVSPDGLWHTYTISKATMNSLRAATHYCIAYGTGVNAKQGTYYFDNVRFVPGE